MKSRIFASLMAMIFASVAVFGVPTPVQAAVKYKTCAALYKKYPYGVKLKGAKDKVKSGFSPVTNPKTVSTSVYNASKKLDTDKDKMICELPKYKNCAKLNSVYPHGFGLKGAVDKVAGTTKPVTTFKVVSTPLYNTNKARDRDSDKIACEKL